jgi:hypothetical protein
LRIIRDQDGDLSAIELDSIEMRELLAFEATCACLVLRSRRSFLEATMQAYRIPIGQMLPLLEKEMPSREDVWKLQVMKRQATGSDAALEAIGRLRRLEAELGRDVLETYVDRRKIANGT